MSDPAIPTCTAFTGQRVLSSGLLPEVALAVRRCEGIDPVLVFEDATGRLVDLDLRGSDAEIVDRLSQPQQTYRGRYAPNPDATLDVATSDDTPNVKTRGRPKLGVVAREVTLLPKQWEWLADQPGGASATLRRLVDDARKGANPRQQKRAAQDAAYRFMQAIAGDLPGYEEATRALFADDTLRLEEHMAAWPDDIRDYALRLACGTGDEQHI
ncbi:DUF2239 family protein [Luteibacter sp. UNCMF366Tsu5.1]|uniref:DUF2239 family protein n=1 Tax=Luteibacter sp. UNCMF366Tsu5.1 TaxID=1502758 RepID=UPI000908C8A4|nr:DUF2239 family protein [Luteibacter sp. UNCMF366Tsu5.1]SFW26188.1 hypothetical protein SAMN02800691_0612 [Luteibacter sp. UNCMF366Tsu5.1]